MNEIVLKPYMGYSAFAGEEEGAVLIFARTAREARKIGYQAASFITDEYIDFAVHFMRNSTFLYADADQAKLRNNIPHVIDQPTLCKCCEFWGMELDAAGLCENCREADEVE